MNENLTQPLYLCKIGWFSLLTILHRNEVREEGKNRDFYIDIVCVYRLNRNIYGRVRREKIDLDFD